MTDTHRRRRRGFAIADFLAGMLVLAGALTAFATMTKSKMDALAQSDQLARGVAAAEEAIDRVRVNGLPHAAEMWIHVKSLGSGAAKSGWSEPMVVAVL